MSLSPNWNGARGARFVSRSSGGVMQCHMDGVPGKYGTRGEHDVATGRERLPRRAPACRAPTWGLPQLQGQPQLSPARHLPETRAIHRERGDRNMGIPVIGGAHQVPDAHLPSSTPLRSAAADINGNDGDPVSRKDASTTDGKSIQQDVLHTGDGLEIRRERTFDISIYGRSITSDQLVVDTTSSGSNDDRVDVRTGEDGSIDIYVNGERYPTTLAEGQEISIRTGDGN